MIKKLINKIRNDYDRKTFILASASAVIYFTYSIYNGILGIILKSIWNGSICIYYLLLLTIKSYLVISESKLKNLDNKKNIIIFISYILLLVITLTILTPIILLIENKRDYNLGLIPAIFMATYTTYSITMAIIHMVKSKKSNNIFVKQIRLINLISTLMSVTVLQNTLILANGGYNQDMIIFTIYTSISIILLIFFMIAFSFYKYIKDNKKL